MLCALSSFHTDGVATHDGSSDCVCSYLYYLTLRMHNLLHSTVLQAIFAKLVISHWSRTDLNLWYHSFKQHGLQHNFCLAMLFPLYLLIFPNTSKISYHRVMTSLVLCHIDCWSITDVSEDCSAFIIRVRQCKKGTWPWRWRHYNPFKCQWQFTNQHGGTSKKTGILREIAVRTHSSLNIMLIKALDFSILKFSMYCTVLWGLSASSAMRIEKYCLWVTHVSWHAAYLSRSVFAVPQNFLILWCQRQF